MCTEMTDGKVEVDIGSATVIDLAALTTGVVMTTEVSAGTTIAADSATTIAIVVVEMTSTEVALTEIEVTLCLLCSMFVCSP